jgi:hypothetical protein
MGTDMKSMPARRLNFNIFVVEAIPITTLTQIA